MIDAKINKDNHDSILTKRINILKQITISKKKNDD